MVIDMKPASSIYLKRLVYLVAGLLLLPLGSARAEDEIPAAAKVSVVTPEYTPDFSEFHPDLGEYSYRVSWEGIKAAVLKVVVGKDGLQYRVMASAKTAGPVDWFYTLRYKAEGILSAVTYSPISARIVQRENSRHKDTNIEFLDSGEIKSTRYYDGKFKERFQFASNNLTLDPFSAAFIARSFNWDVGTKRFFDIFTGKSRYLISLESVGKEKISVNGKERDVWVIVPSVSNLTDPDSDSKLKKAKLYVTADSERLILKIVSSVFVGSVKTQLQTFKSVRDGSVLASKETVFRFN